MTLQRLEEVLSDEEMKDALSLRSRPSVLINYHPELEGERTVGTFVDVIVWGSSYKPEVIANALMRIGVTENYQVARAIGHIGSRTRTYDAAIPVTLLEGKNALRPSQIDEVRLRYGDEITKGDLLTYLLGSHS